MIKENWHSSITLLLLLFFFQSVSSHCYIRRRRRRKISQRRVDLLLLRVVPPSTLNDDAVSFGPPYPISSSLLDRFSSGLVLSLYVSLIKKRIRRVWIELELNHIHLVQFLPIRFFLGVIVNESDMAYLTGWTTTTSWQQQPFFLILRATIRLKIRRRYTIFSLKTPVLRRGSPMLIDPVCMMDLLILFQHRVGALCKRCYRFITFQSSYSFLYCCVCVCWNCELI